MNLFPTSSASSADVQNNYFLPTVIEKDGRGERAYDIYSRLLKDRIIFIGTGIDDTVANSVIAQMLFLQMQDPKKDIHIYINSPGGSVTAGLAIYDTMQFITCEVNTYCIGICASMGADDLNDRLHGIIAHHTGKKKEDLIEDASRDKYMSAGEAADYGLVDKVLELSNLPDKSKED